MSHLTPLLLIKQRWDELVSGDPDRVARVINELRPQLQQLSKTLIPEQIVSKADDSDVAQDTATRAIRAYSQFKGDSPEEFWAWLVAIQRNEVNRLTERYRAASRELAREQSLDAVQELADHREPEVDLARREDEEIREKVLLTLKPDDQAVIRWRIFERRDLREISILMDREYEAVKKLFARAVVRWKNGCDKFVDQQFLENK